MTPTEAMPALPEPANAVQKDECGDWRPTFAFDVDLFTTEQMLAYGESLRTDLEASRLECERLRVDAERLEWIESIASARKIEIAKSILGSGFEIGEWPSMRVTVKSGSLREVLDAAMKKERT